MNQDAGTVTNGGNRTGSMRIAPLAAEAKGTLLALITSLRTAPTGGVNMPIAAVKKPNNAPGRCPVTFTKGV
jgi:hypothetical protein